MAAVLAPSRRRRLEHRLEPHLLARVYAEAYPTYEALLAEVYGRRRWKPKTKKGATA